MPRVNLHVRDEDWDRFLLIKDRPEWLTESINRPDVKLRVKVATLITEPLRPLLRAQKPLQVNPKSHTYMDPDKLL